MNLVFSDARKHGILVIGYSLISLCKKHSKLIGRKDLLEQIGLTHEKCIACGK